MVDIYSKHRFTRLTVCPLLLVFNQIIIYISAETILGEQNEEFDFDGLPGAQHEFKVDIPGHTEDCFFQQVAEGGQLHVNFEVLKGGDKMVDFFVRDESWKIIHEESFKQSGHFNLEHAKAGTYAICIDNVFSRFGTKLVYIYIVTFVMQEWVQFQMELSDLHIIAANFSNSLTAVQESVQSMRQSQAGARFHVIRDWYILNNNNFYVLVWSVAQCILIVVASMIQVYSVRRLFRTTTLTPTAKPRA